MSPLSATVQSSLLWSRIIYHRGLVLFDFSNYLVFGICPILTMKILKPTFFGPQLNNYKWYILIDKSEERYSKYETKDFNWFDNEAAIQYF